MEEEIWKPIIDHESTHEVSNLGRVRSMGYWVKFGKNKRFAPAKIRIPQLHSNSYKFVILKGGGKNLLIHRLVAKAFIPNPDNKPFVNHLDGNKFNCNVWNLEWTTRQENEDHAFATGLKNSTGEKNSQAKLTELHIKEAKKYFADGFSYAAIGRLYNTTGYTISRALRGKTWRHISA